MNDATRRELGFSLLGKQVYAPTDETEKLTGPWVVSLLHNNGMVQLSCPSCEWGSGGSFDPSVLVIAPAGEQRHHAEHVTDDRLTELNDQPSARTRLGRGLAAEVANAHQDLASIAAELLAYRAGTRQRHGG
jgi:hypothetical protein